MPDAARTGALMAAQARMRGGVIARLVALIVGMLTAYQRGPKTADETTTLVSKLTRALEQGDRLAERLGSGLVSTAFPQARTTVAPKAPSTWTQEQVERIVQEWLANPVPETVAAPVAEHVVQAERSATAAVRVRNITGWRRVIHPELSLGGTCGLCVAATTRVYTTGNLQPIHEGCHCGVLPIVGEDDPGDALNRLDLGDLYDDAGQTTDGWTLKQTRYQTGPDGALVAIKTREKQGARESQAKIQARAKRKAAGEDVSPAPRAKTARPKALNPDAPAGLENLSADRLRHQIAITEALKDSAWRTEQLKRLRKALRTAP